MHLKINLKTVLLYIGYSLSLVSLNAVLTGVPLSLGLCFSMLVCGANLILTPALYVVASAVTLDWVAVLLSVFEGGFLTVITLIYRRTGRKIRAEAIAYIVLALSPFVAFSRWRGIGSLYFTDNPYIIKSVAAAAVLIFTFFSFKSVYSVMYRLMRCKLRPEELLCISVLCTACGTGVYNLFGQHAYTCLAAAVIAFFVRLYKTPSAVIVAAIASAPAALTSLTLTPVTCAVLVSIFALLFCELGRLAPALSTALGGALCLYSSNLYSSGVTPSVLYTLLLALCCLASALPDDSYLQNVRAALAVKKVLPRTEEARLKEYVSGKLYRMSDVFREIECAFNALDDGPDEGAVRRRMLSELKQSLCTNCQNAPKCANGKVYRGFAALIDVGCMKGKVSFVDLTAEVTTGCLQPSVLTETLNRLLYEYRKVALEAENARSGRRLLAGQARGVAEVLKNCATEFCREGEDYSALENKIIESLSAEGVSCPEASVRGDKNKRISVTLVDCKKIAPVKECIERTLNVKLMLKDKIVYDGGKSAYIFTQPPPYDAAFGVAYAVKDGERVSGDTHSVIKISESSFLMALSDGMGSGEYARKISATAISLIEAFYRSEIPQTVVLDTINKLLCFNRDERFTCIDAAAIDLNTLTASFIKIGSPVGIIVRKGEMRVLESHSLPLGILDNLHPSTSTEKLRKNDIVVFMTDGVTSCFDGPADLYDFVSTLKPLNPQSLAEKILSAAKSRTSGTPDDMTVLCVRVFERPAND